MRRRDVLFGMPALLAAQTSGMVRIPGGTFDMGSDAAELRKEYPQLGERALAMLLAETPRHRVTVQPFLLDAYEVTNEEFFRFVQANPEWGPPPGSRDRRAVTEVSWHAAIAYAQSVGKRLPTEAEWEWAARGGLDNPEYPWGNDPATPERANYVTSDHYGSVEGSRYPPNGYGLYDMAGNVWEYCVDEWHAPYDPSYRAELPTDWRTLTSRRVIRGGSYAGSPINLRVRSRDSHPPNSPVPFIGFRCAKSL